MKSFMKNILPFLIVIVTWEFLIAIHVTDKTFFPGPVETLSKLFSLLGDREFLMTVFPSLYRLFIGTLLSVIMSLLLSFLCLKSRTVNAFFAPLIGFTFPLPKVAVMPLLMLVFGIGDSYKIAVIFLGMFFLLFINLQKAILWLQKSSLADISTIFEIEGYVYFKEIFLKGVLLDFLVGLKSAMGYGLTLVVVSEFTASKNGIGNFIWKSWDQFRILDLYAAIYLLCFAGFAIYTLLDYFIKKNAVYYKQF